MRLASSSISNKYSNFFMNSEKSKLLLNLIPYLSFADLYDGLSFNSFSFGIIGFFSKSLINFFFCSCDGKYLEKFLFSE